MSMPDCRYHLEWREVINMRAVGRHYVSQRAVWFMRGSLWFVSSRQQLSAPLAICSQLQLVSSAVCFRATSMWNTDLLETVGENFEINFVMKEFSAVWWINLEQRDTLIDKKQKHKRRVLTEEKSDNIEARLVHTPRMLPKRLPQETSVKV
jgi:uncharacterized protein YijF (DUF1287 family)